MGRRLLIISVLVLVLIFATTFYWAVLSYHISESNAVCYLNLLGKNNLKHEGYVILVDANFSKFPNRSVGKVHGYNNTLYFGSSSFANNIGVFIFNTTLLPAQEFDNLSLLYSYFSYEISANVTLNKTINYSGVPVRFFVIRIKLLNYNNSEPVIYYEYGSAFAYKNILALGAFTSETVAQNLTRNLISMIKENVC